jgi:hypothetical protein
MIYRNSCESCGDSYETDSWEPDNCPFCENMELKDENKKLTEAISFVDIDDFKDWSCASCPRFKEVDNPKYECVFSDCFVNFIDKKRNDYHNEFNKLKNWCLETYDELVCICDACWTDRDMHAPECMAYVMDDCPVKKDGKKK